MLDLKTLLMSSEMKINNFGTERLIKLTQIAKGNSHLSGGADGYQEIDKFKSLGISLKLEFVHPGISAI